MTDDIATPDGEPTAEEIREACAEFQAEWTPEQEWSKRVEKLGDYMPPVGPRCEPRRGVDDDELRRPEWWADDSRFGLRTDCAV